MPLRITISDDLQITPGGYGFSSWSGKNLEEAEVAVINWVTANPNHPRIKEVDAWLEAVATEIDRLQEERGRERSFENLQGRLIEKFTNQYLAQGHLIGWARWRAKRDFEELVQRIVRESGETKQE